MTPERLMIYATPRGLPFLQPIGGVPEWTADDLGMALAGLSEPYVSAFAFRWAGDDSHKSFLWGELMNQAGNIADREQWPRRVQGRRYLRALVDLHFIEERNSEKFRVGKLWAAVMDFPESVWQRDLSCRYEAIRGVWERWISVAHYHMRDRLDCDEF